MKEILMVPFLIIVCSTWPFLILLCVAWIVQFYDWIYNKIRTDIKG